MRRCLSDWAPNQIQAPSWYRMLYWLNRDMYFRGLAGRHVFADPASALDLAANLAMSSGLAVAPPPNILRALKRRHGQIVIDLAIVLPDEGAEPLKNHKLVFAWDVVRPTGAAVAYATITGTR